MRLTNSIPTYCQHNLKLHLLVIDVNNVFVALEVVKGAHQVEGVLHIVNHHQRFTHFGKGICYERVSNLLLMYYD
jgi:hypothetical protein